MPIDWRVKARILNRRIYALLLVACCVVSTARAAIRYDIVSIVPLGAYAEAASINGNGDVIGNWQSPPGFIWTDANGYQSLPLSYFTPPMAAAGNNNHDLVLFSGSQMYRYSPSTGYTPLTAYTVNSQAYELMRSRWPGINNAGQISLTREVLHPGNVILQHAYRHTPGVGFEDLGLLNAHATWANAINSHGWIVGGSGGYDGGPRQAFLWRDGMVPLDMREAFAINDSGMIAGVSDSLQPVVLRNGELVSIDLGAFTGTPFSLNNLGQVVGNIYPNPDDSFGRFRPFLWTEGEGVLDLNSLIDPASGWILRQAVGINDAGQIVGMADYNGQPAVFRLDPRVVPEPSTWALLGLGSALFWCAARRRRK